MTIILIRIMKLISLTLSFSSNPSSPVTEHNHTDQVTLTCSVRTHEPCRHSVKWLHREQEVDKDNKELTTSQSSCSASVQFLTSHFSYTSRYKLFKCQVTTETNEVKLFTFSRRPSGEKQTEIFLSC